MHLTQSMHRALQQAPDRPMTICGNRVRTTREVVDRVSRLAAAFQGLGVCEDDRVGILALNSDHHQEFFFGSWWMGAVAHPLNTRWSPAEIAYALTDSGTEVLLVDDSFAALGPELRERAPGLHTLIHCGSGPTPEGMLDYEELIAGFEPVPDIRRGGDKVAFLLYTGGTTGTPKGVMVTDRGLQTSMQSSLIITQAALPDGVNLLTAPLFHIGALTGWYAQNLVGGTLVFLPSFTPDGVLEAVQKHQVTTTTFVPVMVQLVCNHPDFASYDTSSLKRITYGGAGSPESLLKLAMECFPQARFTQGYGMTETSVLTVLTHEDHERGGERLRSAGRATPGIELAVVGFDGKPVATGEVGEIVTRGDHVMAGYWGKPELTAEALRDGWMHTGDAGRLDADGYLYIVDRLKDMIITGGENVYSAEVENALASHRAVASCAVVGVPDEHWGERVHAVIVLRPGATATAEEIRAHAKSLIAGYKAPRSVEFVEAMPLSPAGKILKRELRSTRADG
ncbi:MULTISPECIES: long-chain fatty acid--CoA ligase [unclassified Streptomyces]|uniref:acyl-CoA synthetase n=1 Tax=unclassified Streptomyces TaxID=2593676 RepID=UPI0035DA1C87